jgi:hypothetical protein
MPACRKTPAEAAASRKYSSIRPSPFAASDISVLVVKPEVSGKPEIDSAPTMPQAAVNGIVRNNPPRSVHRCRPVRYTTTPALMNSSAL